MKKIDRIIWALFYLYVMMLPFENFLGHIWQIDTPYRPHRILCLVIGFLILFSRRFHSIQFHLNDLKLAGVYLFGLIPSVIAYLNSRLNVEYFWSTSLQYFVVIWILLLIKNVPFGLKHIRNCLLIYCFGTLVNSLYMIYQFLYIYPGRQQGLTDNPNTAAFACDVALAFFFYYVVRSPKPIYSFERIGSAIASVILMVALAIAGSRGAVFVSLGIVMVILYFRVSLMKKMWHSLILVCAVIVLVNIFNKDILNLLPAWSRMTLLDGREEPRAALWVQGFKAFEATGFMGMGIEQTKNPDNFDKFIKAADNVSVVKQKGLVVHNDFLMVLYEYGIIAFLLFISFYVTLFRKIRINSTIKNEYVIFICLFLIIVGFPMFTPGFQSHSLWLMYMLLGFFACLHFTNYKETNPTLSVHAYNAIGNSKRELT